MKNFFTALIAVILVIAIGGVVFVFAFDKKIPTDWASGQIEAVKADQFPSTDKLPRTFKFTYEEISYSKDSNNKLVKTYDTKAFRQINNKSTEEAEAFDVKSIDYDTKGKVSEEYITRYYIEDDIHYKEEKGTKLPVVDFSEVLLGYGLAIADFYENDLTLKTDLQMMLDANLEYVSQKGLCITYHLVKDNKSINITYSLGAKRIVKFEETIDTYVDSVLSKRYHQIVEF